MKSDTTSLLKDVNLAEKKEPSNHYSCLLARNRLSYSLNRLRSKSVFFPRDEVIPRLELMAALTLANLIRTVSEALIFTIKIDAVFNLISSQIVWCWIQGNSRCFKPFVQNRVQKIRSLWVKELCRYFHTDFNPSDIASRGAKSSEITSSDLWWKGHRRGQGLNPRLGLNFSGLSHSAKMR